jgi:DNA-binding response OmpR family regulator
MTAFPNERDKARALQAGVVGYLSKPFNETELLGFVHSVRCLRAEGPHRR